MHDVSVENDHRRVSIALAGCGAVGGALAGLLADDPDRWRIDGVLVRDTTRRRPGLPDGARPTSDVSAFLDTPADIVVEALGGVEPAHPIARAALERGASFVTANKALMAEHGPELTELADRYGGHLAFDAAVGGGIPVVRTLRNGFGGIPVRRIRGILNGTANFLLSRMESGADYPAVLREAQEAGYAEADPARDLDGRDVADKIRLLAWVAWGVHPAEVRVNRSGLPPDLGARVREAVARGRRPRLIADTASDGPRRALARVGYVEVEADSAEGRTRGVDNLVRIETDRHGHYTLSGPGAGGPATASSVLADLIEVAGRLRAAAGGRSSRRLPISG